MRDILRYLDFKSNEVCLEYPEQIVLHARARIILRNYDAQESPLVFISYFNGFAVVYLLRAETNKVIPGGTIQWV